MDKNLTLIEIQSEQEKPLFTRNDVDFTEQMNLKFLSMKLPLLSNREISILSSLKFNPHDIEYASNRLRRDPEIISHAIKLNLTHPNRSFDSTPMKWASRKLKNDKNFIMDMIRIDPFVLANVSEKHKSDKEIVKEAIRRDGRTLKFASKYQIREKQDVIIELLSDLIYEDENIIRPVNKIDIYKNSIEKGYFCIDYAYYDFNDKNLVMFALKHRPITEYMPVALLNWWYDDIMITKEIIKKTRAYVHPFYLHYKMRYCRSVIYHYSHLTSFNKIERNADFRRLSILKNLI